MSFQTAGMPRIVPGSYNNVNIIYSEEEEAYYLSHKGIPWMGTDISFTHAKDTLQSQYDLAYGNVLLTGLGFGISAKAISEKPEVTSVTVIEINQDIVDAFFAHNTFNEKVKVILADATSYSSDIKYDCLLPDHYEGQDSDWKFKDMNDLAKRIKHDVYWPWSIEDLFLIKNYPTDDYPHLVKSETKLTDLEGVSAEIPQRWRAFLKTYFPTLTTIPKLPDETLVAYIEKFAHYHFGTADED